MNITIKVDTLIVGAGPTGLTLAQKLQGNILVIEKESTLGGAHRVRRENGYFTEHGPRVYSSAYTNTKDILKEMGTSFEEIFTKYQFDISSIGGQSLSSLNTRDLALFAIEFGKLLLDSSHGYNTSVYDFMEQNDMSEETKDYIDRMCRLTDGAPSERYSLLQLLSLVNQQGLYGLYQPRLPNDIGLFKIWYEYLVSKGVTFKMSTTIVSLDPKIKHCELSDGSVIQYSQILLAIPPENIQRLSETLHIDLLGKNFEDYAEKTDYLEYISATFHWNKIIDLPKVWGFPKSKWGLVFIVLSDYTQFNHPNSRTVISMAVTKKDLVPKEFTKKEILQEMLNQLREAFPDLPEPTVKLMYRGNDTAFIKTPDEPFIPFDTLIPDIYNVGTQNGYSKYHFTSLESAVSNALAFCDIPVKGPLQITDTLFIILFTIIITILLMRKL
jgi:hypothetical protein